jgi:hypothetical protein
MEPNGGHQLHHNQTMTNDQINRAIAEACGWTQISEDGVVGRAPGEMCNRVLFVPLYCSNLNAMHGAEKLLNSDELFEKYYLELYETTQSTRWPVSATARQRAEAFLRTLGKWEEVQG